MRPDQIGFGSWSATGADTDGGGVTVTKGAASGQIHEVTDIQCSGDAAALVTVESPADTILYRKRFSGAFTMSETFTTPLKGASGAAVLVKISAATTNSEANIQGYSVKG